MNHKGTKEIETERLILRKFVENDCTAAFYNWCSDIRVTDHLTWPAHKDIEATIGVITEWINSYDSSDFYQWAIVLKDINEPVGSISIPAINEKTKSVEIGYAIGVESWNKGIVTEAFSAIIKFLFEEVQVNRIQARCNPANLGSSRVMEKCGLKYEGTLRQYDYSNLGLVDASYYSILLCEYQNNSKI